MQLIGTQFTATSAIHGNDLATFPDYPAEIRAPVGTLAGVSGFQVNFSSYEIHTPGDRVDTLVAMNPAALKAVLKDMAQGGTLIINTDEFTADNLSKAELDENPLETDELARFEVRGVPITQNTLDAVKETGLGPKDAGRCKNFYALGLSYWLYDRSLDPTLRWIVSKFGRAPVVATANTLALKSWVRVCSEVGVIHPQVPGEPRVLASRRIPQPNRKRGNSAGIRDRRHAGGQDRLLW